MPHQRLLEPDKSVPKIETLPEPIGNESTPLPHVRESNPDPENTGASGVERYFGKFVPLTVVLQSEPSTSFQFERQTTPSHSTTEPRAAPVAPHQSLIEPEESVPPIDTLPKPVGNENTPFS